MALVLPLIQLDGICPAPFLSVAVVLPLFPLDGSGPVIFDCYHSEQLS